jgi:hypothetical protein
MELGFFFLTEREPDLPSVRRSGTCPLFGAGVPVWIPIVSTLQE